MPQICVPNATGPYGAVPPTPDGYIEPEPWMADGNFGLDPSLVDQGWIGASRMTFGSAVDVGLAKPPTLFQAVKDPAADYIHLAWLIRRDANFDNNDVIVLVLHPTYDAAYATGVAAGTQTRNREERRIHIFPLKVGIGVETPAATSTVAAGTDTWSIREDGIERNAEYYKFQGGSWVPHSAGTPSRPNNITIKVRSWTNNSVNQYNWSIEVRLPTNTTEGGSQWINLASNFGLYFNVVRLTNDTQSVGVAIQHRWPGPLDPTASAVGELDDGDGVLAFDEIDIPPNWLGEALLGSSACTEGVRFKNGSNGVGIGTWPTLSNQIDRNVTNNVTARIENTGTIPANNIQAEFRIANWGIGPGGSEDSNHSARKWNKVPNTDGTSNPTLPFVNLTAGNEGSATMSWTLTTTERNLYRSPSNPSGTLHSHQCIWVQLSSNQGVVFTQSSVFRNMIVKPMSVVEEDAEISGEDYPPLPVGETDFDMLLFTSQMAIPRLRQDVRDRDRESPIYRLIYSSREQKRPVNIGEYLKALQAEIIRILKTITNVEYRYIWITDGYRKTGRTITINGTRYPNYDSTGSFGVIGTHKGPISGWNNQLSEIEGQGHVEGGKKGVYRVRVPVDGSVKLRVRLEADEKLGCLVALIIWLESKGPVGRLIARVLKLLVPTM
jgi:hypothetical protein